MKTSEIIQIDSTIIAGILILLTIISLKSTGSITDLERGTVLITWGIILPFSLSAIFAITPEFKKQANKITDDDYNKGIKRSLDWMRAGFGYLIVFLAIFVIKIISS